jgi:hypothetical protein
MGKIRRGGFIFVSWKGDHLPRHVHAYRDGKFIVNWDLEEGKPMRGTASGRIPALIAERESEGLL